MTAPLDLEERLLGFRHAFDHAFAVAPVTTRGTFEDLLAIRVAGDPYALRVRDITGLVVSRKIVPLPSRRSELLGIAGIRGSLVAVYSLAALLGYAVDSKSTAWLALAGAPPPVGLAFEEFEGFLRVRSGDVYAAPSAEGTRPHAFEVVRVENQSRRVVDIPATLEALTVRTGVAGPSREA
jgi:chemotaxis signal transduction protein